MFLLTVCSLPKQFDHQLDSKYYTLIIIIIRHSIKSCDWCIRRCFNILIWNHACKKPASATTKTKITTLVSYIVNLVSKVAFYRRRLNVLDGMFNCSWAIQQRHDYGYRKEGLIAEDTVDIPTIILLNLKTLVQ